jgi:hypothetical protein
MAIARATTRSHEVDFDPHVSVREGEIAMTTRRTVLSQAALGAAAIVSSLGLTRIPAMAANGNGNGNGNDPVRQRRRERRRDRKERRRERRRDN